MFAMELEGNSIRSSTTQKQRVESEDQRVTSEIFPTAASELDSGSLPNVRSNQWDRADRNAI